MQVIKRLVLELRGESIELETGIPESSFELAKIKDMVRVEYQRRGYIDVGLKEFTDEFDDTSVYFGTYINRELIAGARLVESERLPTAHLFYDFVMPEKLNEGPRNKLREVSRLTVLKRPGDNPLPRHLASTMTISGVIDYGFKEVLCGGVSTIKTSFLRLFEHLKLPALHEISDAKLIYPRDALLSGFFYGTADPAVPICYRQDEAKAIFDGLYHNMARVGRTLLDDPIKVISYEVLV